MNGNILIVSQTKFKAIPYTNQVIRIVKRDGELECHVILIDEENVAEYSTIEICQRAFNSFTDFYQEFTFDRKKICVYDMPTEEEVIRWIEIENENKNGRWNG